MSTWVNNTFLITYSMFFVVPTLEGQIDSAHKCHIPYFVIFVIRNHGKKIRDIINRDHYLAPVDNNGLLVMRPKNGRRTPNELVGVPDAVDVLVQPCQIGAG